MAKGRSSARFLLPAAAAYPATARAYPARLARGLALVAVLVAAVRPHVACGQADATVNLVGLWEAKHRFGPDTRGELIIAREGTDWRASIAGVSTSVRVSGDSVRFDLPDGSGSFAGRFSDGQGAVTGHWIQARTVSAGTRFATPVTLVPCGTGCFRGEVVPLDDRFTFYMKVARRPDGSLGAFFRNPERNLGRFIRLDRIEVDGSAVRLLDARGTLLTTGTLRDGVLTVYLGNSGGSYDFRRMPDSAYTDFYPGGRPQVSYSYTPPRPRQDGWPVATVEDVGISRAGIERFVQMLLDMRMDSLTSSQIHSLLIARHGKLVVEEYFHGYHSNQPHDTRSAAKSWTAVLIGAAMQAGLPIRLDTPVYQTMLGALPPDLDPRKRAMTLEHLISMTAGYHCSGEGAPGDEDVMQQQTAEQDWYMYALNVPMLTTPGDTIVYCSIEPDLAAGMLRRISGEPLPDLFHRLVAQPLQMSDYHLFLSPTGEAYGGGGHHFRPRDFLKLPQLMLNDGVWAGRQVISREWARQSGAALRNLTRTQQYGWLWNSLEYPYRGRTVRGFFAGGNGGQIFMAIPDLDLVIGFTGGNYSDVPTLFIPQRVFVPQYILPAVD